MALGLVASQFAQTSYAGYIVAGVGLVLVVIGIVLGVFEQGAHTNQHASTEP